MRVRLSLVLLVVLVIGIGPGRPIGASPRPPDKPQAVVQGLRAGMSEEAVHTRMKTVALDSGTVYWGGSGARRLYFELPRKSQVWVDCAGATGGWKVVEVGRIEPKQRWVRHGGDSITVE